MSRAPRRRFATPFVLTLAAIPACTVQSQPARPDPNQHSRPEEVTPTNPPRPQTPPETPDSGSKTNDQVTGTANVPVPVAQATPDEAKPAPPPGPPARRGYREWTVTRSGATCQSMVKVFCPAGAACNPPPPAKYPCPKDLEDKGRIDIIQHVENGDCFVDFGDPKCPPGAACNPPRPQKMACPK